MRADLSRTGRASIAKSTLEILEAGRYHLPDGREVALANELAACVRATELLQPDDLARLASAVLAQPRGAAATAIEIVNETTLTGIKRFAAAGCGPLAVLNFASAKNPGGGFQGGSQAQEESLARSSGLYPSLMSAWPFYEQHRRQASLLYSDAMILSPDCPVFRDDAGELLPAVHCATFITSPAPNAGAIATNAPGELALIPETLRRRAGYVLALAAARGYRHLILGAWGCGVFRNDPALVATTFMELLRDESWAGRFARVSFSILDGSPTEALVNAFREAL